MDILRNAAKRIISTSGYEIVRKNKTFANLRTELAESNEQFLQLKRCSDALHNETENLNNTRLRVLLNENKALTPPVHLIYRNATRTGLFSDLYCFLAEFEYAHTKSRIPVVDLVNYSSQWQTIHTETGRDPWLEFFEPTSSLSIADAYNSSNLTHSNGCIYHYNPYWLPFPLDPHWANDKNYVAQKKEIFSTYIRLNPRIRGMVSSASSALFSSNEKIVGVSLRGTCYTALKLWGHPIQPDPSLVLEKCDFLLNTSGFDKVYLACPDSDIVDMFRARYGSRLLMYTRKIHNASDDLFKSISKSESMSTHLAGYLVSIFLLCECNYILASVTSSSYLLPLMIGEDVKIEYFYSGTY